MNINAATTPSHSRNKSAAPILPLVIILILIFILVKVHLLPNKNIHHLVTIIGNGYEVQQSANDINVSANSRQSKMGNIISRSASCNLNDSGTSLSMEAHAPSQKSFPRSPGIHDLAAYNPQQDSRGPREVTVTSFAGDEPESGITHPKPARPLIRRYSELLDPTQLESQQVRSPSGNMLTSSTYNLREDRPLSVRERQERIEQAKEKVKKEQEMARGNRRKKDSAKASAKISSRKRSKKRGARLGCFGI